jgi:hypothetical protein
MGISDGEDALPNDEDNTMIGWITELCLGGNAQLSSRNWLSRRNFSISSTGGAPAHSPSCYLFRRPAHWRTATAQRHYINFLGSR